MGIAPVHVTFKVVSFASILEEMIRTSAIWSTMQSFVPHGVTAHIPDRLAESYLVLAQRSGVAPMGLYGIRY